MNIPYRTKRIVPMFTDNEIMSIEEVLSSPSVSHRDAAIFFLGLTTGMRAVDVVDLRLANIDWDNETIFFQQSKTGNAVCLPLTVDIGNSIYRYILEERPRVDDDHVFLRSQAPFIPLGGHSTCYYIVSNILQRAGIQKDGRIWGMCMLRHTGSGNDDGAGDLPCRESRRCRGSRQIGVGLADACMASSIRWLNWICSGRCAIPWAGRRS